MTVYAGAASVLQSWLTAPRAGSGLSLHPEAAARFLLAQAAWQDVSKDGSQKSAQPQGTGGHQHLAAGVTTPQGATALVSAELGALLLGRGDAEAGKQVLPNSRQLSPQSTLLTQVSSPAPLSLTHASPVSTSHVTPSEADRLLGEATEAYRGGDYPRTLQVCTAVYAGGHARRSDLLLLLGAAHYQLGQWDASIAYNDAAILVDPGCAEAHANLANALQQVGSLDLALMYFQSAIRLKPTFTDAYNNMASVFLQRGQFLQACECYQAALAVNPDLADVRTHLGDLLRSQGGEHARAAALQAFQEALKSAPAYAPAWRGLGDVHREAGDSLQAISCYQHAISLQPPLADAHTGLGTCMRELKRYEEAEASFRQAVALRPRCALTLGNLAGVLYEQGKLEAAIATYQQAIACQPHFPEAYNNCGNALREAGRPEEAIACYTACINLQLGAAALQVPLLARGLQTADAKGAALLQAQRLSVAYNNLGGILKLQGRMTECCACYEQVALLQPGCAEAHANLGSAFKDAGQHEQAVGAYSQALALRPDFPEAHANYAHSLQCVCDWADRPALFARLEADVQRDMAAGRLPAVQPFHAMAYPFSAELALAISQRYAEFCLSAASKLGLPRPAHPPAVPLGPGQRLRVGYVSSDFGNHPLSHLMASVFDMHDRSKIEVFCYALSADDGSEWRARISREAEHFLDVSSWGVGEIAQRISEDGIHVCVNLNGYTKGARNEIFALQPAPVQVNYMGFPATMGAPYLPWIILDRVVCPPSSRHCFSECVAYMPHTYFANDYRQANADLLLLREDGEEALAAEEAAVAAAAASRMVASTLHGADPAGAALADAGSRSSKSSVDVLELSPKADTDPCTVAPAMPPTPPAVPVPASRTPLRPSRASLGLPEDAVVYFCANQLYKMDPQTFSTWCNILRRVPGSVLWLLRFPPAGEHRLRREAATRGIDPARIIFTDVAPKPLHIARSALADVFLDTPLCNAHTTGCDVLWSGCPMVTLPLERMASRVAASLCSATGLGAEMVVGSQQEYEDRAVELGLDREKRLSLRRRLRAARASCPLFDTRTYVTDLERCLLHMWEIHCEGKGPRDFEVASLPAA